MTNEGEYIQRFTVSERITHILLFSSLIILSITGLTLKYHESAICPMDHRNGGRGALQRQDP